MAVNPNYVPWLSILGVAGAGLGYLLGQTLLAPVSDPMVPALFGLTGGVLAGFIVRIVLRQRANRALDAAGEEEGAGEDGA